jgi:hypothetical protein
MTRTRIRISLFSPLLARLAARRVAVARNVVFAQGAAMLLALLAATAFAITAADNPVPWIVAAFLAAVPFAYWIAPRAPAAAWPGMMVMATVSMCALFIVDTPLFGEIRDLRAGEPAPAGVMIAGYRAPDWRIEAGLAEHMELWTKKRRYGDRLLAPLVAPGWAQPAPVALWVDGQATNSGRIGPYHPMRWNRGGDYVRAVGLERYNATIGVERAIARLGLPADAAPVIVHRVDSIAAMQAAQLRKLALAAAILVGLWGAALALTARFD